MSKQKVDNKVCLIHDVSKIQTKVEVISGDVWGLIRSCISNSAGCVITVKSAGIECTTKNFLIIKWCGFVSFGFVILLQN